jgi:hypothetical protein
VLEIAKATDAPRRADGAARRREGADGFGQAIKAAVEAS